MNLEALESQASAAESLLKAVANRRRLVILCELLGGEKSVSALRGAIGLSQSALSQHLARLRADEIVATRRESQTIYYSLASDRATKLIGLLHQLYCAPDCGAEP
jgi:DNA-binding transcriptional ArsR family regulator